MKQGLQYILCFVGFATIAFAQSPVYTQQVRAQSTSPNAQSPKFEVASVRLMKDRDKLPLAQQMYYRSPPGAAHFMVRNASLTSLITMAYKIADNQLTGKPAWLDTTYYEIDAKPEGEAGLSDEQLRPLLLQLLQERFHLAFHRETKDSKGYALVIAKGGPKLQASKGVAAHAYLMPGRFDAFSQSVETLAGMLAYTLGVPVVDKTGLQGNYDITLKYAPMEAEDSSSPSLSTALEEQLGLKLEKATVPMEMFAIDHVDMTPTLN